MTRTLGVYLIYAAVVLRAAVVVSAAPEFPIVMGLLAGYGLLLFGETWLTRGSPPRRLQSRRLQVAYLLLQSGLVIGILISATFEDFLAMLFIPLSLDAVAFFGRRPGFVSIAGFSLAMTFTLLFSEVGWFFGLVMGILYSGLCFLFGGYAHQVLKAEAAHEQNEQMINRLEAAHRQLQGYARQKAGLAVEHQRNRLARDLHDSVTQTIFSMNLAAQSARLLVDQESPRAAEQLLRIEELAASALQEIQSLVSKLGPRSLVEESLPAALRRLAAEQHTQAGLDISLEIQGGADLPDTVAASLYCIAQEALINVSKHSGVCEAIVRLSLREHGSYLQIEDSGNGFDPESALDRPGHLGLAVMTERASEVGWHLAIRSQPGQGTCIRVTESPAGALP